jgi:hypothetical protein
MLKNLIFFTLFLCVCPTVSSQVPPPQLFTSETYTKLFSASYDYQGNGSVKLFLQNPSNANELCAVMMGVRDSNDPSPFNGRRTYISYSLDNGTIWFDQLLTTVRSGFPNAAIINSVPVIAVHEGSPNTVKLYQDLVFGAGAFWIITPTPLMPNGTWAGITGNPSAGNQMCVVATVNNSGGPFPMSKITSPDGSTWSSWSQLQNINGVSGCHSLFSGAVGLTGVAGYNYDSAQISNSSATMYYFQSSNYGVSFNSPLIFYTKQYIGGTDTLYHSVEGGMQGTFIGNEPHIVFGVYGSESITIGPYQAYYSNCKILHWSPGTGITTVADRLNSPSITDTVANNLAAPRCHPTIGKLANGTLVCAFTGFPRGQGQYVGNDLFFNTGDIFLSYSYDTGRTWIGPINYSNTPNIEEKQPSLIEKSIDNTIRIIYFRDMKPGYFALVPEATKAPYYCIMKKSTLVPVLTQNEIAGKYELQQNFPNPFNPETMIKYSLAKVSFVTLKVYDITGKEVSVLVNSEQTAGAHTVNFNAGNLSTGIYYYTINTGEYTETKKMVLIK